MATGMRLAKLLAMLALVKMPPPPLPLVKLLPPLDKLTLPLVKLSMLTLDRMLEELERPVFRLIVVNPLLVLVLHTRKTNIVSDPDPDGSALILVGWIRIQEVKYDTIKLYKKTSCFEVHDVLF
jgi:hypothetical protein